LGSKPPLARSVALKINAGALRSANCAVRNETAFVLVDLTHDNSGAYWEAGYAEGLGKPVIYICEQSKFDAVKTHFDTNHCTTVMWKADEPAVFTEQLVATLRRSLNLFPEA
jgi:nucleoside 2-deoxyribosyltransferase